MMKKYTESHEWIKVDGEEGIVGISSYALEELGEVVFLQLPKVGERTTAGEPVVVAESTKAAADIYAPVSGEIIAVNETFSSDPHLINELGEEEGWLFKISVDELSELDTLLDNQQYLHMIS